MAPGSAPRRTSADLERLLFGDTLDELIGAALVLDDQLRIRIATPATRAILGFDASIARDARMKETLRIIYPDLAIP